MIFPSNRVRIVVATKPVDFRKGMRSLAVLVEQALGQDPFAATLYVFTNRRRTQLKALYFDRSGYCVWAKRLEQGRFHPLGEREKQRLEWTELKLILEGIDLRSVRRYKRYQHPAGGKVAL